MVLACGLKMIKTKRRTRNFLKERHNSVSYFNYYNLLIMCRCGGMPSEYSWPWELKPKAWDLPRAGVTGSVRHLEYIKNCTWFFCKKS